METTKPDQSRNFGTLNPTNPENILYNTEELGFAILGGIRLDGLDRMRVTLKIEVINRKFQHYINNPEIANLAIRHNIDLYNDTQVEKLIRKTADKLEVGTTAIAISIADITSQLESYRLQQLETIKQGSVKAVKKLSETEYNEALAFLQSKKLLEYTNEHIGNAGVIGEELNRIIMFLVFTSRKMNKPLHIISFGSSGMGKSHLQESIGELIPEEDRIEITSLTENAFYYFDKEELGHKLLMIEDLDGALTALYPLRELQSKQRISKTITIKDTKGNTKTIHLKVNGPVTIAGCTTKQSIYEDNANRSFLIYLDESEQQDERIMDYQRKLSSGNVNTVVQQKTRDCIKNSQRILQPITIKNPYAEYLKIPKDVFKPRRTNAHYLAFIEAITFYYQYQRIQQVNEETGEIYIETTIEDIENANHLIKEILLRKSDELTGGCRNYFERLKKYVQENNQTLFTNNTMKTNLHIPISTVKRHHAELVQNSLLKKIEDKTTKANHYEIISNEEYQQLQNRIATVLDDIIIQLKTKIAQPPKSAQNKNERMKANTSNRNRQTLIPNEEQTPPLKNNEEIK
jgi:predicted transcriptional regulator